MSRISRTDLFGHPRGLTYLFTLLMWQREASATMRTTKFPCIEYILYFIKTVTVVPDGLWYVNISL